MQNCKPKLSSLVTTPTLQARISTFIFYNCRLVNLEKERNSIVFLKKGEGRLMETKAAEEEELKLALQRKAESEKMLWHTTVP